MKNMKDLYEYISVYESRFAQHSWNHGGAYDYAKAVLNDIINGKQILMADDEIIKAEDFDLSEINYLLDHIDKIEDEEAIKRFNNSYKGDYKKSIWANIQKKTYSGATRKLGGGLTFENVLCANIQALAENENAEITDYKEATYNFWEKIKNSKTIKEIRKKIKMGNPVSNYINLDGTTKTTRNEFGQLIDKNTFEVNMSKKINLDRESEGAVTNVLTQSGKIIADIIISYEDDFEKNSKDIDHVNPDDIYISLKDSAAQQSAISMQQPFYGDEKKTSKNTTLIKAYKANKSYEEFMENNDVCTKAFSSMCKMFNCDPEQIYYYFKQDVKDRKTEELRLGNTPINNEIISTLLHLQIGGNYWYVNSNGDVVWIDDDIDSGKISFVSDGKGLLDPKQIQIFGKLKTKDGFIRCNLKFRTSMTGADYPYRLFLVTPDKHAIQKLYT